MLTIVMVYFLASKTRYISMHINISLFISFNKLKTPLNYSIHEKSLDENWHVLLAWGQLYIGKLLMAISLVSHVY